MRLTATKSAGVGWRLGAAVATPFAIASLYLLISRWPSDHSTNLTDYAALSICVLAGAAFIATLPIRSHWRILALILFIPVTAVMLAYYAFWFLCELVLDQL